MDRDTDEVHQVHASADARPEIEAVPAAPSVPSTINNDLHQHPQPPADHEKSSSDEDAEDHGEDEIETDPFQDEDSAFAEAEYQSETATLESDILRYREENGRTYHSYGARCLHSSSVQRLY